MTRFYQTPSQDKCDELGIDEVCNQIINGVTMTDIARSIDVSIGSFINWIDGDAERSARMREARAATARLWDERATSGIEAAEDAFQLAKAKEIAHHYRWRAAKIAPREYGERQAIEINDVTPKTPEQVDARIAELMAKAAAAAKPSEG